MQISILRSGLVRMGFSSAMVRASAMALTIAVSIVLARNLGPEGMGFYAFALSIVMLAGLPVQLGVPVLVLRETAYAVEQESWGMLRGIWSWAARRVALSAAVVLPVLGLVGWLLEGSLVPKGGSLTLLAALPLVPLFAAAALRGSALRGLQYPVLGQLPEGIVRPVVLLLALILLSLTAVTPPVAAMAHVGAAVMAFLVGALFLLRVTPEPVWQANADLSKRAEWARAVWPLALISGIQIIMQNLNIVLLGAMRSPDEVGLFRVAMSAANMTLFGLTVVNFITAPTYARLNAKMNRDEMAVTAQCSAAVSLGAALPVGFLLVLAGPWFLALLYGEDFAAAYLPMAILVAAQMINGFFGSCGNVLNMTGNERHAVRALIVALVVNAGLSLVLVPRFGGPGAACATLVSTLTWNLLMDLAVRRELGFTSSALGVLSRQRPRS